MRERVGRLLNLRAGEGQKTFLLYSLHFLFYVGLTWGYGASRGLFVSAWGPSALRYIFVGDALLSFGLGLLYAFFADRVSNTRLLIALLLLLGGGLVGVRLLLALDTGERAPVYPLFLLLYRALRPISTLHLLNYLNDFYDTRAAKRALPLLTSASIVGAGVAGLVSGPLIDRWGAENLTLAWIGCLLLVLLLVWVSERRLGRQRPGRWGGASAAPGRRKSSLDNLRDGFRFVRGSSFLRLLALATLAMALINNLFSFQVSWAVDQAYPTQEAQTLFYTLLDGVSNVLGLLLQVLLLSRLLGWLGVGAGNLIFPLTSLLSYSLLGLAPNLVTAVGGQFNQSVLKRAFRNPIDAMLYNTVPLQVKGRARAFINGLLVPVGILIVGGLLFLVPQDAPLPAPLVALGVLVSLLYVGLALRLRREYGRALVQMLEQEDFALYRLASAELNIPDEQTFDRLVRRLESSPDDDFTIFVAEIIAQAGGRRALPVLRRLATDGSPRVRGELLTILSEAGFDPQAVRALCRAGLSDAAAPVRRAALRALQRLVGPADPAFLTQALPLLEDPDLSVRAEVIPPLIRSGDFFFQAAAVEALSELLKSERSDHRAAGVQILGQAPDPRFVLRLVPYLEDPDDRVRRRAARAVERLTARPLPPWLVPPVVRAARRALGDPVEPVRLTAVTTLEQVGGVEARQGLVRSLGDGSRRVRERATEALQSIGDPVVSELQAALAQEDQDEHWREAISAALARIERERFGPLVEKQIAYNLRAGYETLAALHSLAPLPLEPGVFLLRETLWEGNDRRVERVFDLIASVRPPQAVQVVAEHLRSPSARVRANAVEALESLTSPRTARLVAALAPAGPDRPEADQAISLAREEWEIAVPAPRPLLERYLQGHDPWLQAVTVYALGQVGQTWFSRPELAEIFDHCADESQPREVREAGRIARSRRTLGGRVLGKRPRLQDEPPRSEPRPQGADAGSEPRPRGADPRSESRPRGADAGSEPRPRGAGPRSESRPRGVDVGSKPRPRGDSSGSAHPTPPQGPEPGAFSSPFVTRSLGKCSEPRPRGGFHARAAPETGAGSDSKDFPRELVTGKEGAVLATIERVIFLKGVPFFESLTLEQLRILAGIGEERTYDEDEQIFAEGDVGDALYIVVSGRVSIERAGRRPGSVVRLATLSAGQYFGEMSIFDQQPRSASAVALEPIFLFSLRRAPLLALVRDNADLSLELIRVLSRRLREANRQITARSRSRPRQLEKLYDKLAADE